MTFGEIIQQIRRESHAERCDTMVLLGLADRLEGIQGDLARARDSENVLRAMVERILDGRYPDAS